MRSAIAIAVCVMAAVSVAVRAQDPAPPAPVWPAQWHADVWVTGPITLPSKADAWAAALESEVTDDPIVTLLPRSGSGHYYYDSSRTQSAFVLRDDVTGQSSRTVSVWSGESGAAYQIDGPSGTCTAAAIGANSTSAVSRLSVLPVNFVAAWGFQWIGNEYYLRDGNYFWTQHWSWNNNASGAAYAAIDYYHCVQTGAPFRIVFTQGPVGLVDPVVVDVSNGLMGTFDDVAASISYVFSVPSSCPAPHAASAMLAPRIKAPRAAPPATGTPWPLAFHAAVAFTGNDFGFPTPTLDLFVQQTLFGDYYYDWVNGRESTLWRDGGAGGVGARTKTTIVNTSFHAIDLVTGTCVIPPTAPVNGPLRPQWPTNLKYVDSQLLKIETNSGLGAGTNTATYAVADHYRWDAFAAGLDHSFNYWQRQGVPLQFNGPVLEFWPYYQSFIQYSEFTLGLDGVDLEFVFGVPTNCTVLPQGELLHPENWGQYDGAPLDVNKRLFQAVIAALAPFNRDLFV